MKLKSKLIAAAGSLIIVFSAIPANTAYAESLYKQQNIFITTDGQIVDTFMDVPARYATYYAWSGQYSCAAYASDFYKKHFGVSLYDINSYKGRPHIYYPGHTCELRDVDKPIPGDLVQALDYSHVAIVKEVDGDTITLIEQNWKWNDYATGKPICTVNRKVGLKDNYYYRLYIDGVEQRLPQYQNAGGGSGSGGSSGGNSGGSTVTKPYVKAALATNVTRDGFSVSACAEGSSLSSFRVGTYLKSKGASTAKWTTASASGSIAYTTVKFSVSDFGNEGGTYVSVVEITDAAGQKATKTIETLIDRTPPTISNVAVTNNTPAGYTVTCNVKDENGVNAAFFPSWTTKNGKDDLPSNWASTSDYSGKISNGTASFTVKTADHGNQYGEYNTTVYVYDTWGNCTTQDVKVNVAPEKIAKLNKSEYRLETGRPAMLTFTLTDAAGGTYSDKPVWTSSDENVVTVLGGTISAHRAGKAVITATAAGKSATCTVTVTENIEHVTLQPLSAMTFTGDALEPEIVLTCGDKTLTKGTDYTVSFTNNTNVGHGIVTIRGTGSYSGARTAMFNIIPAVKSASDSSDSDQMDDEVTFAECTKITVEKADQSAADADRKTLPDQNSVIAAFSIPETMLVNSPLVLPKVVNPVTYQFAQLSKLSITTLPRFTFSRLTAGSIIHYPEFSDIRVLNLIPLLL